MFQFLREALLGLLALSIIGCTAKPVPPEVRLVETQEQALWREGAPLYAPSEYASYKDSIRKAKDIIIKEQARLGWFRDYSQAKEEYKKILTKGQEISKLISARKTEKRTSVEAAISLYSEKIENIRRLSSVINEGVRARTNLTKAEILLSESRGLFLKGDYIEAEARLKDVPGYIGSAEDTISPIVNRYVDGNQIAQWRRWVEETKEHSRVTGGFAIVISKADRTLTLLKAGEVIRTYSVGLGRNGSLDKLHSGDNATPEGKYYITRKIPRSKYYKALLINYPNEEDRRRFVEAKRKGLIPVHVGIGGLVEIHGGGKDSMTYGCIALENQHMQELYDSVGVGTPVTIVGATDHNNGISKALGRI